MATRRLRNVASSCGRVRVSSKNILSWRSGMSAVAALGVGAVVVMEPSRVTAITVERGHGSWPGQWRDATTTLPPVVEAALPVGQRRPDAQGELEEEPVVDVAEVHAEQLLHLPQPVAHGVRVNVQARGGPFQVPVVA